MARRYGRSRRSSSRKISRRRSYATRTRRYRRRAYRNRTKTTSSVVCLTQESFWQLHAGTSEGYWPFTFSVRGLPGFEDYQSVYSHFRVLKAKMYISTQYDGGDGPSGSAAWTNYLVVGSRPFMTCTPPLAAADGMDYIKYAPIVYEPDLRQARFQRVHYPRTTSQAISVSFYPYTMVSTFGPAIVRQQAYYQRIWEGKKWMPFAWAYTNPQANPIGNQPALAFFGPFIVRNTANSGSAPALDQVTVQLKVWLQFKGQK